VVAVRVLKHALIRRPSGRAGRFWTNAGALAAGACM
jgi:hypothetical protein